MVFSSIVFLLYFLPIVLVLYFGLGFLGIHYKNAVLLIASLIFYAWGEPKNIVLLVLSCIVNYLSALFIDKFREKSGFKKATLIICIAYNLIMFFIFKYLNFTIETLETAMDTNLIDIKPIALPIGISFFTFQALSYVIDVYRGDVKVQKNPFLVALYVSLFPQLVAGPIVRYKTVEMEILTRKENTKDFSKGFCRFIFGLSKKIFLSNGFAVIADTIYGLTTAWHTLYEVPALLAWLGAIAYVFQLFFDFSAYSDMAIGLGRMFGFHFDENFDYPLCSKSIAEFWRRWHISLSVWFKEYLYIPLGGSRVPTMDKVLRNMFIVWLFTGIWHGANWTFIVWGLFNFAFVLLERFKIIKPEKWPTFFRSVYVMLVIIIGFVFFRSSSLIQVKEYFMNMLCLNNNAFYSDIAVMLVRENFWVFLFGIIFSISPKIWKETFPKIYSNKAVNVVASVGYVVIVPVLLAICILYLVRSGYNPFIYFNF